MTPPSATASSASVLVFTPTPTHPPIQGNRQRVFDMCRAMQSVGAELTLLYYATEGVSADEARAMRETWGDIDVVFPRGFAPKHSLVRSPAIDDWYDPAIGDAVARLCAERRFDVCISNYAWYSKLFDSLPDSVVRVIDTHDVFGGRAERFAEIDRAPEWFHTSVHEESIGLDRADFVIAIQDLEAEILRRRTNARVRSVGFLSAANYLPPPETGRASRRLKVGYLGSGNPFNVSSVLAFARALQKAPDAADLFDVHLAGSVCNAFGGTGHPFITRGIVRSVSEFYRSVDVVINPMVGGTGLKIKSLEALSFGKPLVATVDAMTGIESDHEAHMLRDPDELAQCLRTLAAEPGRLVDEAAASRRIFHRYRKTQLASFLGLWSEITAEVGRNPSSRSGAMPLQPSLQGLP